MSGVSLFAALLNGFTCGAIGAATYKIIFQNKDVLHEKIKRLKEENNRLYVKIYALERVNEEWEIAWIDRFNCRREKEQCLE